MTADKLTKALSKATGKLAADDQKTYETIIAELIKTFNITSAPDVMCVNRLVSTWMKMRRVEELLSKYELFFEVRNKDGNLSGLVMNQLVYYLKSLESDFRAYYRVLKQNTKGQADVADDFHDFINKKEEK